MTMSRDDVMKMVRDPEGHFPQRRRFYGVYYGLVEDNKDPLKLGRLKVRTAIHFDTKNIATESLPWANYAGPYGGDGTIGFYAIPPIGAQVLIAYIDGDTTYQVWLGTVWGTPEGVSETHVSSINELDPYDVAPVPTGHEWDYVKYNSLTTTSGLKFEMDDNLSIIRGAGQTVDGVDLRRIGLEIPGDVELAYNNLTGSFGRGLRVVGQVSGASGLILDDTAGTLSLLVTTGRFRDGEDIVDSEGASASVTSVTVTDGFFVRLREDKLQDEKPLSGGANFRGVLEMGTRDERVMRFDDEDETIRIETPESLDADDGGGHYMEINSVDDFIRFQTEGERYFVMDDPEEYIEISTHDRTNPTGSPLSDLPERGYTLRLDQKNNLAVLSGDDKHYSLTMREAASQQSFIGLRSQFPDDDDAGISIINIYGAVGGRHDSIRLFANEGQGELLNGVLIDRGIDTPISRPAATIIYDQMDVGNNPTNMIRLVGDGRTSPLPTGEIWLGNTSAPANRIVLDPDGGTIFARSGPGGTTLESDGDILIYGDVGSGSTTAVKIQGPWVSEYFNHKHHVSLLAPPGNALQWFANVTSGSSLGFWPIVQQNATGLQGPLETLGVLTNT